MSPAAPTHGRILRSAFRPHPLLRSAHLQTITPALLRPRPPLPLRMERLELSDGDFVDLGWAGEDEPGRPIAVLVHGLGGGLESKYIGGLGFRLISAGWRVCALQLRGGGAQINRHARNYHHGDTADLRELWEHLRAREDDVFLATVGWSLGGNVVLKALGEEGEYAAPDVACAVSVPFRLYECAEHLRHGFTRLYQHELLEACKNLVRRKHAAMPIPAPADVEKALAARDFFEFDNAWTAPLNGFRDAADYYARAACGQYLKRIARPTLILHALDDPFMRPEIVPMDTELSPSVTLELSEAGGHVGFIGRNALGLPQAWGEERILAELVKAHAEHQRPAAMDWLTRRA